MKPTSPSITALREFGDALHELEGRSATTVRRPYMRLAVAAAGAAVIVAGAFTPVGQAVGELLGIGDPPRETGHYGDGSAIADTGETPAGHPYQVVVNGASQPGETCVFLGFPEVEGTGMGSCLWPEMAERLQSAKIVPTIYNAPAGILPDGAVPLQGLLTADVAKVDVTFQRDDGVEDKVLATVWPIGERMQRATGITDPKFAFFAAFLPAGAVGTPTESQTAADLQDIEIRAFADDGSEVASSHLAADDVRLSQPPLGQLPKTARQRH